MTSQLRNEMPVVGKLSEQQQQQHSTAAAAAAAAAAEGRTLKFDDSCCSVDLAPKPPPLFFVLCRMKTRLSPLGPNDMINKPLLSNLKKSENKTPTTAICQETYLT
jgi:hypothetical protein